MGRRIAKRIVLGIVVVLLVAIAPVVPIQVVLDADLPAVTGDEPLTSDEIEQIVIQARGGRFLNLVEIADGRVNAPFTHVSTIGPNDSPYDGSVEDRSDVVIGHGACGDGPMSCSGYKVFLRRTSSGWQVVERVRWMT